MGRGACVRCGGLNVLARLRSGAWHWVLVLPGATAG